jgi:hypothetical protein
MGAALGGIGVVIVGDGASGATAAVASAGAVTATLLDVTERRLPSPRRQVDETWLVRYRDWVHGAGFGLQLGFGAVTIVTSASLFLTWLLELLAGSIAAGAVIGAVFGLARALPLIANRTVFDASALRASQRWWQQRLPLVHRWTSAVMLTAGVLFVVAVGT